VESEANEINFHHDGHEGHDERIAEASFTYEAGRRVLRVRRGAIYLIAKGDRGSMSPGSLRQKSQAAFRDFYDLRVSLFDLSATQV
jgi:hypothetical protein